MLELSDKEFFKVRTRNRALSNIMSETRVGVVEGISFDLRHKQINPEEWIMQDLLGGDDGRPPTRSKFLPFLWFPWYGKFDLDKLKADTLEEFQAEKEYAKNAPPTPREAFGNITDAEYVESLKEEKKSRRASRKDWMKRELNSRTPDAIVMPGDSVEMHHAVTNLEDDDEFVPLQDRAFIHLFIKITNEAGLCNILSTPIVMYGATRISYLRGNKGIYSILNRVRGYHKIPKIDSVTVKSVSDDFNKTGHAYTALYRAIGICERFLPRARKLANPTSFRYRIGAAYLDALDDACMLGYAWAYAEAEQHMRPLAVAGAASRAGAARAGQASGARRRAKAASTWQGLVKIEASKLRAESPSVSQAKLAEEIKFKCDNEVPSHPIIVRYLARLEREGGLPKRRK